MILRLRDIYEAEFIESETGVTFLQPLGADHVTMSLLGPKI